MISILCPTRGRPEKSKRMIDSAVATAESDIEIKLYLNDDDPTLSSYTDNIDKKYYTIGPDQSPAYSWNILSNDTKNDIFFLAGDDITFVTKKWDIKIVKAFSRIPDKLACIYPLHPHGKKHKNPHFCLHKEWKNTLGYFVPPQFWHWYVDTWTREIAISIGRYILLENVELHMEKDLIDHTSKRVHKLSLRERDHYLWKTTQRWLAADIQALKNKIQENSK